MYYFDLIPQDINILILNKLTKYTNIIDFNNIINLCSENYRILIIQEFPKYYNIILNHINILNNSFNHWLYYYAIFKELTNDLYVIDKEFNTIGTTYVVSPDILYEDYFKNSYPEIYNKLLNLNIIKQDYNLEYPAILYDTIGLDYKKVVNLLYQFNHRNDNISLYIDILIDFIMYIWTNFKTRKNITDILLEIPNILYSLSLIQYDNLLNNIIIYNKDLIIPYFNLILYLFKREVLSELEKESFIDNLYHNIQTNKFNSILLNLLLKIYHILITNGYEKDTIINQIIIRTKLKQLSEKDSDFLINHIRLN